MFRGAFKSPESVNLTAKICRFFRIWEDPVPFLNNRLLHNSLTNLYAHLRSVLLSGKKRL